MVTSVSIANVSCNVSLADRKKDLVKLQAGEYVSLGKVEAELKTCPIVENICVYGDSSKCYTVCLLVPHPQHLAELAQRMGLPDMDFEQLCHNASVEKAVVKELQDHARKCECAFHQLSNLESTSSFWVSSLFDFIYLCHL